MRIPALNYNYIVKNKPYLPNIKKVDLNPAKNNINFKGIEYYYPNINLNEPNYRYKTIVNAQRFDGLVGNYDNLDKFSELFADKINSNLISPTEKDIEKLVSRIQIKTGASKKTIKNVLYNLTLFSNYDNFSHIFEIMKNYNIRQFGLGNNLYIDSITNMGINYLVSKRDLNEFEGKNTALILDDKTLSALEEIKKSSNSDSKMLLTTLSKKIKYHSIVFLNIKGWDVKTENNGYKSANILTGTGYLEDLAAEVIQNIKNGKPENEIYYSDFKKRLYALFEDDIREGIIDIKNINIIDVSRNGAEEGEITSLDILKNIKPKTVSKEQIKAIIKSYIRFTKSSKYTENEMQSAILKYLDEQARVYSLDGMTSALKKINKEIEDLFLKLGYDKDDIVYIIPENGKSFDLITAMYAQINNIKPSNINYLSALSPENKDKAKVILDDISATGFSEKYVIEDIRNYIKNNTAPILYASLILCKSAKNSFENKNQTPDFHKYDIFLNDMGNAFNSAYKQTIAPTKKEKSKLGKETKEAIKDFEIINHKDFEILNDKLINGFGKLGLCVVYPYAIPDNCSDLTSLIFEDLLFLNNQNTNKPFNLISGRHEEIVRRYYNIRKYAKRLISSEKV